MNIASWNIHGLTRHKLEDQNFVQLVSSYDICFLYESWTDVNSKIDITGYTAYNFYRKILHKRAKRCSGGVCLYMKNNVVEGVTVVKSDFESKNQIKLFFIWK